MAGTDWADENLGAGFRGPQGAVQKRVTVELDYLPSDLEKFIERVRETAAKLSEVKVSVESEEDYGSTRGYLTVVGWRLATAREVDEAREARLMIDAANNRRLDNYERELRKARPEVFR